MKKKLGLLAALALFSITGCGGGGSGSSVSSLPLSNTPITIQSMVGEANETDAVDSTLSNIGAGTKAILDNGLELGSGLTLKSGSLKLYDGTTIIADFNLDSGVNVKKYDSGYIVANLPEISDELADKIRKTELGDFTSEDQKAAKQLAYGSTFTGTVDYEKKHDNDAMFTIVLNDSSNGLALESSTFGMWAVTSRLNGNLSDGTTLENFYVSGAHTIAEGNTGASNVNIATLNNAEFTGNAIGYAYSMGEGIADYKDQFIYGTASLKVNAAGDGGSAQINFPGYYDLNFNSLSADSSRLVTVASSSANVTDLGAAAKGFGIQHGGAGLPFNDDSDESAHGKLEAGFYANSAKGAETVGNFSIQGENRNGVYGSFGAVKK